ncbi:MAG: exodeoxyribonuclease V subunit gamma [Deltaproteobacteria bacterium]|nr:exodeoxyribonuclease V subunit gamma [Deltaproteobacteria bacterium]
MLTVVESNAATGRLVAAADFVCSFRAGTELLLLGATREAVDDFAYGLAAAQQASFGWHRFTLLQLAAWLAQPVLAARAAAPTLPLASEALAARAIFGELNAGRLPFLSPVARFPGFARAVAASLDEIRLARIAPEKLAGFGGVAAELAHVQSALERELTTIGVADRAALLAVATEAVRSQAPLVGCPLLLLDVPLESRAERDFVAALVAVSEASLATVPKGDERTLLWLQSLASDTWSPAAVESPGSSLERLRSFLFSDREPLPGAADDSVQFFSAPGEQRECVEIARSILDEAQRGTRFDDIAVFVRSPESYSPHLQYAFRRASIPAYFARGTRRPDPAGRAFLALLACKAEGLSAKRFAEYLSLAQVPGGEGTGDGSRETGESRTPDAGRPRLVESSELPVQDGTLRAPWRWEELLVEAAVIGGKDRWLRRLDGLAAQIAVQLDDAERDDPLSPRVAALRREQVNLEHLCAFALPLIDRLAMLPSAVTWGEWLTQLNDLAPRALRQPQRVLALLAELQPMAAVGPVGLGEVYDVLSQRLSTLEDEPPASRFGRVFIAPPEQARGRRFAVVFIPGLAERIFPQRPREDALVLDELRLRLGSDLLTQDDRARRERLQLRLALGAASRRVVVSYPRVEVREGRPRVPSFYGLDIERAISGRVPDHEDLQQRTAAMADARLAWPAPTDPRRAIDDIEHDLAVLGVLLRHTSKEHSQGRARYLLELNAHLARALRGRWARWETKKWQPADGLIRNSETVHAALDAHRLAHAPCSVSALQRFSDCPYQFFLAAIVGLEARQEPLALQRIDPLTRGRIVHATQAQLLRGLQSAGRWPLRSQPADALRAELDSTLDAVAAKFRDDLAPAIARVWHDEINTIRTDLRIWLQRLVDSSGDWEPWRFELGFGLTHRGDQLDPHSIDEASRLPGDFLLRGAVDLVERRHDGKTLRITDYKTGKDHTPAGCVVGGGRVLQPVLYSLAVEAALQQRVSEARLFFCTTAGGFSERFVRVDDDARAAAAQVLKIIDTAIGDGHLPPAPREGSCVRCDYRDVCGPYEEIRAGRKDASLLKPLETLRGLT